MVVSSSFFSLSHTLGPHSPRFGAESVRSATGSRRRDASNGSGTLFRGIWPGFVMAAGRLLTSYGSLQADVPGGPPFAEPGLAVERYWPQPTALHQKRGDLQHLINERPAARAAGRP